MIQMKRQNLNLSTSPQKNFQDLISSIQSKLQLLASENFDVSQREPFACSMPVPIRDHSSPNKSYLQLEDLTTPSPSPSPVMERLSQMEQQYISQITSLNHKLSFLEVQNQELRTQNEELQSSVIHLEGELRMIEESNGKILENRVQEMQQNLMHKMREEIEQEVSNYIVELEQMRKELVDQKNAKRLLEKEKEMLLNQRNNFEFLYKEILQKYKQILESDIQSYQKESKVKVQPRYQQENKRENNQDLMQIKKIKQHKDPKKRRSKHENAESLSKQQLIPFLTKGIEELKQKLKLK